MRKFDVQEYQLIKARERVYELLIDGTGVMNDFEKSLRGTTYESEFKSLVAFIQHFANGGNPGKKVKFLKTNKGSTEYEFISKHLRLYATQETNGKLLMHCGKKKASDSSDSIAEFRNIKEQYVKSLKK